MSTSWLYDERFLEHDTGRGHPERPDRLRAIVDKLNELNLDDAMKRMAFKPVDWSVVHRIHDAKYIERVRQACAAGLRIIDSPDCPICKDTLDIAQLGAGAVTTACSAVMEGDTDNAFCTLRPPGHHAERDHAMGFCFINNVAVGAESLIANHGLQRVAIVDFDVHHGNGTQHIFEERKDVLFISLHESPLTLYPGTGYEYETGMGEGEGYTLNLPMAMHTGDDVYRKTFEEVVIPRLEKYEPQFILISAGFDAAKEDPLAHLDLSEQAFHFMTEMLVGAAKKLCNGRLVSVLEGGYNLDSLSRGVARHVQALLG